MSVYAEARFTVRVPISGSWDDRCNFEQIEQQGTREAENIIRKASLATHGRIVIISKIHVTAIKYTRALALANEEDKALADEPRRPPLRWPRIKPLCAWYDMWMGAFWDRKARKLYVLPLPCLGVVLEF